MTIKGKVTRKIDINKQLPRVHKRFNKDSKRFLKDLIQGTIQSGHSPVNGKGKFRPYSKTYADRKKGGRRSPVTMIDTGKMLASLKFRETRTGLTIWFSSKIAKFHDQFGAGKGRVIRRLLPRNGEKFTDDIMDALVGLARIATKQLRR